MKQSTRNADPKYQQIAGKVEDLISAGTFRAGDRLPSVRSLSRDWGVSVTTAIGAYSLLEDKGVVEARDRSGYFVRPKVIAADRLPRRTRAAGAKGAPVSISSADITEDVMDSTCAPGVVPFGAAVPCDDILPTSKLMTLYHSVIRSEGATSFQYAMPPGREDLRIEIAKRLIECGIAVSPEEIIVTSGAMDAILLAIKSFCEPGDVVAVESPTYFGILSLVKELGLKAIEVPVLADDGVCVEALEEAFKSHPVKACILQPNFHNPMGSVIPTDSKRRIVELAEKHQVTIIEDDLYGDLFFGPKRPPALKAFDPGEVVIHCGSYSKALAPGLRVGWILPDSRYHRVKNLKYATSIANATVSEMVVAAFLKTGGVDRHLRKIRKILAQQTLQIREAILKEFPEGTRVSNPKGGFVLWCEMPDGFDSEKFSIAALNRKISIVPGTLFSATCGLRNLFRISCGSPLDDRSQRAIGILARLAQAQLDGK